MVAHVVTQTSHCTGTPIALAGCTDCTGRILVVIFVSLRIIIINIIIISIISIIIIIIIIIRGKPLSYLN